MRRRQRPIWTQNIVTTYNIDPTPYGYVAPRRNVSAETLWQLQQTRALIAESIRQENLRRLEAIRQRELAAWRIQEFHNRLLYNEVPEDPEEEVYSGFGLTLRPRAPTRLELLRRSLRQVAAENIDDEFEEAEPTNPHQDWNWSDDFEPPDLGF
jgi:hypothetical protein